MPVIAFTIGSDSPMQILSRALIVAATLMWSTTTFALDIAGAQIPDHARLTPDGPELRLNGAGERTIFLFRIYVLALYLPQRQNTMSEVMAGKGPKRLLLTMQRDLTGQQVHDYLMKRLNDTAQASEMSVLKTRMADLDRIIESVATIEKSGTIALDWLPGKGTVIRVNDVARGEPIAGEDFYQALLRIWLSERAKSPALREALLGKAAE